MVDLFSLTDNASSIKVQHTPLKLNLLISDLGINFKQQQPWSELTCAMGIGELWLMRLGMTC